jgi:uncharacterized membrane protein
MIICLVVGGFSLLLYTFELFNSMGRPERLFNFTEFNTTFQRPEIFAPRAATPFSYTMLINGIVLIVGGIAIWKLTRDKELTSTKEKLTSLLLLPEERSIILELKKSKGSMTQSQIVRNTGMSKVKAHRIVSRLVAKGIVKKYPYGSTNKLVLEKEV